MTRFAIVAGLAAAVASVGPPRGTATQPPGSAARPDERRGAASEFSVVETPIRELQESMRAGRSTSVALVSAYLERIRKYDKAGPQINAMIALNPRAAEEARDLDEERRKRGPRGVLHGVPIVVKDNYSTADLPTTAASKALESFETGRDAFMVKRLREAGAVILGKTNMHELAYGITNISSMGGQTRNPYDPMRNPGGSSGGTGAAVAASFAAAGMGSDTCGSIRNPSASNNLFGLRGTMGLSSREGIVPLAHSQDIGGPLARSVADLAIMLDATVGFDAGDPVTGESRGHVPRSYLASDEGERGARRGSASLAGVRVGLLAQLFGIAPEDGEVGRIVRDAINATAPLGAGIVDVGIPAFDDILAGTSVINAEFKFDLMDFLARFPGAPMHTLDEIVESGKYDPAVDTVLKRANAVSSRSSDEYRRALEKRAAARRIVLEFMSQHGLTVLAYPTLRRKPATIGQQQLGSNCQLSATTGLPAISMPAGFTADGLPVGVDLLGGAFSEPTLLRIAFAYEKQARPRRPPATTP